MATKNNVTRLLTQRNIPHELFELPDDEKRSAEDTARLLNVDPAIVFKSIVITRPTPRSKPLLVLVPATAQVDLRALAAALGEKKLTLPTQREAEQLTGLQAGGISPLALLNKGFQVYLDSSAQSLPHIHISAGQRGLNLRLAPTDLLTLTGGRYITATTPTPP